jgi:hypothetical protein
MFVSQMILKTLKQKRAELPFLCGNPSQGVAAQKVLQKSMQHVFCIREGMSLPFQPYQQRLAVLTKEPLKRRLRLVSRPQHHAPLRGGK